MADNSMDDNKWNKKKDDLEEWFSVNPEHSDLQAMINGMFAMGDNKPASRGRYWTSIAGLFCDIPNSPIGQGRKSLMTTAQKSDFERYLEEIVRANALTIYGLTYATAKTHGKSGGYFYKDLEGGDGLYADDSVKKERTFLNGAFNAFFNNDTTKKYHWDGSYDDAGYPVVTRLGAGEEE